MKDHHYVTCCVNSTAEDINNMVDDAREVTYKTFFKHVDLNEVIELFPHYDKTSHAGGLTIKNDWHITYHRSKFKGFPCYYMQHSGIEYIFMTNDEYNKIYEVIND